MMQPLLRKLCHAYAPARRSIPSRAGAKNKSLIACDGCIEGITPSLANRGISCWIDNLRVLDSPARFANFSLVRRHGFERLFVKIENQSVGPVADRVCFHLDAAAQRFFEHRSKVFGFLPEKTGSFGRVAVRLQQSRAARAERAVENHFDRALGEMVIERVDGGSFAQEILRVLRRDRRRR